MFIYKTTNNVNQRIYVGKSKFNNENYLGSGRLIKAAIKKYGKTNFSKEIIDNAYTLNEINQKEIYWIKTLKSHISEGGYNIAWGGEGGDTLTGNPRRKEILANRDYSYIGKESYRKHMSDVMRGNPKLIYSLSGRHLSEDHKDAIKDGIQKSIKDPEKRDKISHKGIKKEKPFSQEHRDKLSKLHKDKPKSEEHKEKIRLKIKGKKRCPICKKYFSKEEIINHILIHNQNDDFSPLSKLH